MQAASPRGHLKAGACGLAPAAPLRSSPLLAGKQLTRGGCQRCWLLDPAAATCSLTCKPEQAYANGWGRAPGSAARENGGGGRSPASKFPPHTPPLLHHHLPASICLPSSFSSSSSIHKIRAALPSTVACDGQPHRPVRPTGQPPKPTGPPAPPPAPLTPARGSRPHRQPSSQQRSQSPPETSHGAARQSHPCPYAKLGSLCPAPHTYPSCILGGGLLATLWGSTAKS